MVSRLRPIRTIRTHRLARLTCQIIVLRMMKLFTVGQVEMYPQTLDISGTQLPYFRTQEFIEDYSRIKRSIEIGDVSSKFD